MYSRLFIDYVAVRDEERFYLVILSRPARSLSSPAADSAIPCFPIC